MRPKVINIFILSTQ